MATSVLARPGDRAKTLVNRVYSEQGAGATDEGRAAAPARLNTSYKYLFRSYPGTMGPFAARLPVLPSQFSNEKNEERLTASWKRRHAHDGDLLEALQDKVQGDAIVFAKIHGKQEVWYGTDDEDVAAYLRARVATQQGEWQWIYEERPQATFLVNGEPFPQTPQGFEAARRYVMETSDAADALLAGTQPDEPRSKRKTVTTVAVSEEPISVDDALATLLDAEV